MMRAHDSIPGTADRVSGEAGGGDEAGPRVALYSHDTMGIGHVRRNLLIAQALSAPPLSAAVLLLAGVKEASRFPLPPGTDCLTLPSLHKTPDGLYRSRALTLPLPELIRLRARAIASALRAFRPDVLVVDKEPLGVLGELEPTLRALRGRTRCVLGLRDVLDDPVAVRREWEAAGNEEVVRQYYDAVWVYGDPGVYDLVRECGFGPDLLDKVTHVGYLDPRDRFTGDPPAADRPELGLPPGPFALCTVGGGQDGGHVAEAFAAADLPPGLYGVVITGPFMPPEARSRVHRRAAADPRLRVLEFTPEPCRLIARAERVVAMGGYNTVCEILGFGKPALVVPRVSPRREQLIRAQRLREMGLLDVLRPEEVTPEAVSRWLHSRPAPTRPGAPVDLNGARRLPQLVRALLSAGSPAVPVSPRPPEVRHAVR